MQTWLSNAWSQRCSALNKAIAVIGLLLVSGSAALAESHEAGGEANLKLPDLSKVTFLGVNGHKLLLFGLLPACLRALPCRSNFLFARADMPARKGIDVDGFFARLHARRLRNGRCASSLSAQVGAIDLNRLGGSGEPPLPSEVRTCLTLQRCLRCR